MNEYDFQAYFKTRVRLKYLSQFIMINTLTQKKIFIETYGCQMNEYDSELIRAILTKENFAFVQSEGEADVVMRVTSDCPLIDPAICGRVIELFERSGADYACNNMPARFPHGLDCEVFKTDALLRADLEAKDPYDREHVTPWIRKNKNLVHACLLGPGRGLEGLRWTLDHADDLEFFRAFYRAFGPRAPIASAAEIAAFVLRRQDLHQINARWVDHKRLESSDRAEIETAPQSLQIAA